MKTNLRELALKLRIEKELSYTEIRKRLRVSKSTLSYWLREFPLPEDKIIELRKKGWERGESARERFRNRMRAKREVKLREVYLEQKKRLSHVSKDAFLVAGLMLYLGEGDKKPITA